MSFKSKIRNAKDAVVGFCKKHKTGIGITAAAVGGAMVGGSAVWMAGKIAEAERATAELNAEMNEVEEARKDYIDMISEHSEAEWDKEWNDDFGFYEHASRQIEHLEGKCWVIAGWDSYYNPDPDTVEFYVVDENGTWHHKPDDEGMFA